MLTNADLLLIFCLSVFPQADGEKEVLVAGDPERKAMKKVVDEDGITYHPNFIEYLVIPILVFVLTSPLYKSQCQ